MSNTQDCHPLRRLPLHGTSNTRDLGGYPCLGGQTKWGVFLRSDGPDKLSEDDIRYLSSYGVQSTIDLRSDDEREKHPSALETADGFAAHHVSMNDQLNSINFQGDLPGSMSGLYISLLDDSVDKLREVFNILAADKGGIFFHCAIGKDRTGLVAMLLLKLAGVDDADVIADYSMTEIYIRRMVDNKTARMEEKNLTIPTHVFRSLPASMERTLQHLATRYGTAQQYLQHIGATADEIEAIRAKFIQA